MGIIARLRNTMRTTESPRATEFARDRGLVRRQPDELDHRLCALYDAGLPVPLIGAGGFIDQTGHVTVTTAPAHAG